MPSRSYHEALWEGVPAGVPPPELALRRRFLLERVCAGERVLDVGCGEGWFASELVRAGVRVIGIDVASEPLRRARARDPGLDLRLTRADGQWPVQDASCEAIWAGETIEHVADTAGWLSEARRVLAPGGRLLLSTPAHGRLTLLWLALSRRAFDAHFDPLADHLRFYTRSGLTRLLGEFGFQDVSVRAAAGLPGARRLLLARAVRSRW
ncbi:MAG TPA: class I SAM-dependent methyltransferase [Solirubrobacteraceae bacterium]|jgi:ubiquinone/menaquinone biosynthesis C-methylase UbiE|nr:class I SAM-dependent methyltransferase [Solirubrobacteraceae bacterium]